MIAEPDVMKAALNWNESGWPDFVVYNPIFAAAPEAKIFGTAIPRNEARATMESGPTAVLGEAATQFGLLTPLEPDEQDAREALQFAAHCDVLPRDMLPIMVDIQRLREAWLAQATLEALDKAQGPVVVITGNGHARTDWGVPVYLAWVRPELNVIALGQAEDGELSGAFDITTDAPAVDSGDPCAGPFETTADLALAGGAAAPYGRHMAKLG